MEASRKLLSAERESLILQELGDNVCTITELGAKLNVSEATVRRDLQSLEEQGRVRRVHGGAVRTKFSTEPIFTEKASLNEGEKTRIAELALGMIEDGDTIFLDGGSTVLALSKLLDRKKNLTVVTNSLMAAAELMESPHKLILVGGEFRALSRTFVGVLTDPIINMLRIKKAFLGTIGFSLDDGLSTTDPAEAHTKELVLRRSEKNIVLADSSKIGVSSFVASGSLADVQILITDPRIQARTAKELRKRKIEVIF